MGVRSGEALVCGGHVRSGWIVAQVRGTIDYERSRQLGDELDGLIRAPGTRLLLNLSQVDYLDTTALATIMRCQERLAATGGRMVLCMAPERVRGLIRVTHLHRLFEVVDDEAEVLGAETPAGPR